MEGAESSLSGSKCSSQVIQLHFYLALIFSKCVHTLCRTFSSQYCRNGLQSTFTIISCSLKSFEVIIFWLEIFHALSHPTDGVKEQRKCHRAIFLVMNGYEKDSKRYSESELLLDFSYPSSTFRPVTDQGVQNYAISTRVESWSSSPGKAFFICLETEK